MNKQPPPAPTTSAVGPCPTIFRSSRTPRHWKFTQHHRTTRPPSIKDMKVKFTRIKFFDAILTTCNLTAIDQRSFRFCLYFCNTHASKSNTCKCKSRSYRGTLKSFSVYSLLQESQRKEYIRRTS